jgi:hypothetical protein
MKTYTDPWHSYLVAYHQRIYAADKFSSIQSTNMQETNSWFIPGGLKIIQSENIEEDGAKAVWEQFAKRYGVDETGGLRVGDSADIIAMHKVRPGKPAPIDSAIQAIWEKRTLIANIPNVIYSVLMPFLQIKKGVMLETTDANGQKQLITSTPQQAVGNEDPEKAAQMAANYAAYTTALTNDVKNVMRYRAEGGVLATGPDTELKVVESASSIAPSFITAVLGHFNADIGEALGFPYALIIARGGFGTTDDPILRLVKTAYAGSYFEYERVAMDLIREKFAGRSWNYEIELRDDQKETGTFTFEETGLQFKLGEGDPKDALKEAQTELINFQTAQIAKTMGASASDIKAFLDEKDQGLWEFDNFDVQPPSPFGQFGGGQQQDKEDLEGDGKEPATKADEVPTKAGMEDKPKIESTTKPTPEESQLAKDLMASYAEAQKAIEETLDTQHINSIDAYKDIEVINMSEEIKSFNENHDPVNGQFTGGSVGGVAKKMMVKISADGESFEAERWQLPRKILKTEKGTIIPEERMIRFLDQKNLKEIDIDEAIKMWAVEKEDAHLKNEERGKKKAQAIYNDDAADQGPRQATANLGLKSWKQRHKH